jgi:hypothetical protein
MVKGFYMKNKGNPEEWPVEPVEEPVVEPSDDDNEDHDEKPEDTRLSEYRMH